MKKYEKPVVLVNEELAEGVYAASGDCWTGSVTNEQKWNGSHHEFEIRIIHSDELLHISNSCTVKVTFNNNIDASNVGVDSCTFDSAGSNYVIVTRYSHGNSYKSGDDATFKVRVKTTTGDQASVEALAVTGVAPIACDRQTNVQGENDSF